MKKRLTSLLLALIMVCSMGASALAAETAAAAEEDTVAAEPAREPDPAGTVTFENLESRIRENNLNYKIVQESVDSIEGIDYEKMKEDVRKNLNYFGKMKHGMFISANMPVNSEYYMPFDSYSYSSLESASTALRSTFDDLNDGVMQEDNAAIVRQLKNVQDQISMGGESLYLALVSMETQEASLKRQLAALDRSVQEMELRYKLGQISALTVTQVKAGRSALASGLSTLQMNIRVYKTQLEQMLGTELTGEIQLGAMPTADLEKIQAMDLEKDLEAAKAASYELFAADRTMEDAKEDFHDTAVDTGYRETDEKFRMAKHTLAAAEMTHENTIQSYEMKFRVLYSQVKNYLQVWENAKVQLASQKAGYAATELKYQQGKISKNELLSAQDDLTAAEETVTSAANDLFASYNTYCWAVEHGILN